MLYGLLGVVVAVTAALIAVLSPSVTLFQAGPAARVPKWTFSGDLFIGQPIPFAWKYDRDSAAGTDESSILFQLASANDARFGSDFRSDTFAEGYHKYMSHINAARFWRVRAVESGTRRPISDWSVAVRITQYDSAYDRIKSTRKVLVSVSNAEVQGAFKWVDDKGFRRGFDIRLAGRIVEELSTDLAIPLELVLIPVPWTSLLDTPRQGRADLIISSIARLEYRQPKFQIEFSDAYYCTTQALIYRVGRPDHLIGDMIGGEIVGVQEKTTNAHLAEELLKSNQFQLTTFANTETLIDALLQSKIDYGVVDIPFAITAQFGSRLNGRDQLSFKEFKKKDFPPTFPEEEQFENYAIAVRAGEHDLLNVINNVIDVAKKNGSLTRFLTEATQEFEDAFGASHGSRGSYAPSDGPRECVR